MLETLVFIVALYIVALLGVYAIITPIHLYLSRNDDTPFFTRFLSVSVFVWKMLLQATLAAFTFLLLFFGFVLSFAWAIVAGLIGIALGILGFVINIPTNVGGYILNRFVTPWMTSEKWD